MRGSQFKSLTNSFIDKHEFQMKFCPPSAGIGINFIKS